MGLFGLKVGGNRHNNFHEQQQHPQQQYQHQSQYPPPNINHLHKRSETTNSYTESEFSSTGSSSSYTSTESIGYHPHPNHTKPSTSPRPVKKVPLALRPNVEMLSNVGNTMAGNDEKIDTMQNGNLDYSNPPQPQQPQQSFQSRKDPVAPSRQVKRESVVYAGNYGSQNQPVYDGGKTSQHNIPRKPVIQTHTPERRFYPNSQYASGKVGGNTSPQEIDLNTTPTFGISANASQQSLPRTQQDKGASRSKGNTPKRPTAVQGEPQQQIPQHDPSSQFNQNLYFGHQQAPPMRPTADASVDDEAVSEEEDDDSETTSTNSFQPTQHPYYEQWKQYYQALAMQQQQQQQRNSMCFQNDPQFASHYNPMMPYGYPQIPMPYMNNGMNQCMMQPQQQQQLNQMESQVLQNSQSQSSITIKQGERRRRSSQIPQSQSLQNMGLQQQKATIPGTYCESDPPLSHMHEQPHDYLQAYQRKKNIATDNVVENNELLRNSRKSTIKSNRSISEPQHAFKKTGGGYRVSSLESNFKPQAYNVYSEDDEEVVEEPPVRVDKIGVSQSKNTDITQSMSNLVLSVDKDETTGSRQISDYTKYLFDDDDDDESEQEGCNGEDVTDASQEDQNQTIIADQAPLSDAPGHMAISLTRKDTTSSEASYNSIQKEENFQVAPQPPLTSTKSSPTTPQKQKKGTKAKVQQDGSPSAFSPPQQSEISQMSQPWQSQTSFDMGNNMSMPDLGMMSPSNPMMPMQMPMNMPPHMMMPYNNMNMMGMNMGMGMGMNPMVYQNGGGYPAPNPAMNRHSMMMMMPQDTRRQSMMMYDNMSYANKRNSMPMGLQGNSYQQQHQQPKLDPETQKRIKEFKKLRSNIASGNKTMEYRLLWTKMLITATNFKLYNYINIKGEFIHQQAHSPSHVENNKAAFIKASVTHIVKIVKEIESGHGEMKSSLKCKAYFIYACLLKNDFVEAYEQDFGIGKNIPAAIKYFNKVLDLNRRDPRVLYKLGEVYEYDVSDEDMAAMANATDEVTSAIDKAIDYYTNSAQYGYERAEAKLAKYGITIESI
ncbi:hypothetical protein CANMA_002114 [Candida margitis]|uniref:uncharacterized protein n=1 Tax=Candida margitis TaxID=1775924 RepID=UPI002226F5A4|nr:uncharacterized protein CANMA_002114 [Candida margitis]KAI5968678.1 hypothetical protein CANMA_002114 [Candida margitis]